MSCTGFFKESDRTVDTILRQAKLPKDRFRAQCTKLKSLVYQQKHDEMAQFAFKDVLRSLGVFFATRPTKVQVVVELIRTKMALRKVEAKDFLSMQVMENEKMLSVIKVLNIVGPVIFLFDDKGLYLVSTLRQVRYALKFGISPNTPSSIVAYAIVQQMMGKLDDAYKLGKVSVDLSSREENLASRALCLACTGLFIYSVRDRLDTLVDPFLESYRVGMTGGSDFAAAFYGLAGYLELRYQLGTPLAEFDDELKRYCQQMKELQAHHMRDYHLPMHQYVKNLRGQTDDPVKLVGDVLNADEQLKIFQSTDDTNGRFITNCYRLRCQASFEEWDLVEETLPLVIADVHSVVGGINYLVSTTDIAMASLHLFEKTDKKKYRRIAKKFAKVLEKAHDAGTPVATPLFKLVKAEWKAVVDDEDARDDYDAAIEELVCHKLVAYETMAYQRVMHLMIRQMNTRRARDYLAVSLARHRKWGNIAKAEYLESEYAEVMKSVKPAYEVEVTKRVPEDEPCCLPIGYCLLKRSHS